MLPTGSFMAVSLERQQREEGKWKQKRNKWNEHNLVKRPSKGRARKPKEKNYEAEHFLWKFNQVFAPETDMGVFSLCVCFFAIVLLEGITSRSYLHSRLNSTVDMYVQVPGEMEETRVMRAAKLIQICVQAVISKNDMRFHSSLGSRTQSGTYLT